MGPISTDPVDFRRYPRFPCRLNVHVALPGGFRSWEMTAVDISVAGLRVEGRGLGFPLAAGDSVEISFPYRNQKLTLSFVGVIVHTGTSEKQEDLATPEKPVFGIKITRIDEEAHNQWHDMISSVREGQDKTSQTNDN